VQALQLRGILNMNEVTNKDIFAEINKHFDELKEQEFNLLMDYINKQKVEMERKMKENSVFPNDKIILSADVFSKIVNIVSFAENNDVIEAGLLEKIFKDIKNNRSELMHSESKQKEIVVEKTPAQKIKPRIANADHFKHPHSTVDNEMKNLFEQMMGNNGFKMFGM
jgi:hypothetical protein